MLKRAAAVLAVSGVVTVVTGCRAGVSNSSTLGGANASGGSTRAANSSDSSSVNSSRAFPTAPSGPGTVDDRYACTLLTKALAERVIGAPASASIEAYHKTVAGAGLCTFTSDQRYAGAAGNANKSIKLIIVNNSTVADVNYKLSLASMRRFCQSSGVQGESREFSAVPQVAFGAVECVDIYNGMRQKDTVAWQVGDVVYAVEGDDATMRSQLESGSIATVARMISQAP